MATEPREDMGVPASPSGYSAEPEPSCTVSAVPVSIPNAWPLFGYAPGNYSGRCHCCGEERYDLDKRASQCLECAVRDAKKELIRQLEEIRSLRKALQRIISGAKLGTQMFESRVVERKGRLTWHAVNVLQDNLAACEGTAASAIEARRAATGNTDAVEDESAAPQEDAHE